jgi:glycine oxidase
VTALIEGCRLAGVMFIAERLDAVADDDPLTVVAAGCWSGAIAGVDVPIRPVKGQLLRLRGKAGLERVVRGLDVYIVPRPDGEVVVGATAEERGFDTMPTAGAVHDLLRDAIELVPDIAELELAEVNVGLRPATPDNHPVIERRDNMIVATGHYRNGVLLAPLTADMVLELADR